MDALTDDGNTSDVQVLDAVQKTTSSVSNCNDSNSDNDSGSSVRSCGQGSSQGSQDRAPPGHRKVQLHPGRMILGQGRAQAGRGSDAQTLRKHHELQMVTLKSKIRANARRVASEREFTLNFIDSVLKEANDAEQSILGMHGKEFFANIFSANAIIDECHNKLIELSLKISSETGNSGVSSVEDGGSPTESSNPAQQPRILKAETHTGEKPLPYLVHKRRELLEDMQRNINLVTAEYSNVLQGVDTIIKEASEAAERVLELHGQEFFDNQVGWSSIITICHSQMMQINLKCSELLVDNIELDEFKNEDSEPTASPEKSPNANTSASCSRNTSNPKNEPTESCSENSSDVNQSSSSISESNVPPVDNRNETNVPSDSPCESSIRPDTSKVVTSLKVDCEIEPSDREAEHNQDELANMAIGGDDSTNGSDRLPERIVNTSPVTAVSSSSKSTTGELATSNATTATAVNNEPSVGITPATAVNSTASMNAGSGMLSSVCQGESTQEEPTTENSVSSDSSSMQWATTSSNKCHRTTANPTASSSSSIASILKTSRATLKQETRTSSSVVHSIFDKESTLHAEQNETEMTVEFQEQNMLQSQQTEKETIVELPLGQSVQIIDQVYEQECDLHLVVDSYPELDEQVVPHGLCSGQTGENASEIPGGVKDNNGGGISNDDFVMHSSSTSPTSNSGVTLMTAAEQQSTIHDEGSEEQIRFPVITNHIDNAAVESRESANDLHVSTSQPLPSEPKNVGDFSTASQEKSLFLQTSSNIGDTVSDQVTTNDPHAFTAQSPPSEPNIVDDINIASQQMPNNIDVAAADDRETTKDSHDFAAQSSLSDPKIVDEFDIVSQRTLILQTPNNIEVAAADDRETPINTPNCIRDAAPNDRTSDARAVRWQQIFLPSELNDLAADSEFSDTSIDYAVDSDSIGDYASEPVGNNSPRAESKELRNSAPSLRLSIREAISLAISLLPCETMVGAVETDLLMESVPKSTLLETAQETAEQLSSLDNENEKASRNPSEACSKADSHIDSASAADISFRKCHSVPLATSERAPVISLNARANGDDRSKSDKPRDKADSDRHDIDKVGGATKSLDKSNSNQLSVDPHTQRDDHRQPKEPREKSNFASASATPHAVDATDGVEQPFDKPDSNPPMSTANITLAEQRKRKLNKMISDDTGARRAPKGRTFQRQSASANTSKVHPVERVALQHRDNVVAQSAAAVIATDTPAPTNETASTTAPASEFHSKRARTCPIKNSKPSAVSAATVVADAGTPSINAPPANVAAAVAVPAYGPSFSSEVNGKSKSACPRPDSKPPADHSVVALNGAQGGGECSEIQPLSSLVIDGKRNRSWRDDQCCSTEPELADTLKRKTLEHKSSSKNKISEFSASVVENVSSELSPTTKVGSKIRLGDESSASTIKNVSFSFSTTSSRNRVSECSASAIDNTSSVISSITADNDHVRTKSRKHILGNRRCSLESESTTVLSTTDSVADKNHDNMSPADLLSPTVKRRSSSAATVDSLLEERSMSVNVDKTKRPMMRSMSIVQQQHKDKSERKRDESPEIGGEFNRGRAKITPASEVTAVTASEVTAAPALEVASEVAAAPASSVGKVKQKRRHLVLSAMTIDRSTPKQLNNRCELCYKVFFNRCSRNRHMRTVHSITPGTAIAAATVASVGEGKQERRRLGLSAMTIDVDRCTSKQLNSRCKLCDKVFFNRCSRNRHVRTIHSITPGTVISAATVASVGEGKQERQHLDPSAVTIDVDRSSQKRLKSRCEQCGKVFFDRGSCKRHVKTMHVPGRAERINVDRSSQKRLKSRCHLCGKVFFDRGSCKRHVRSMHVPGRAERISAGNFRMCRCELCGKVFANRWSRDRHVRIRHVTTREESTPASSKITAGNHESINKSPTKSRGQRKNLNPIVVLRRLTVQFRESLESLSPVQSDEAVCSSEER